MTPTLDELALIKLDKKGKINILSKTSYLETSLLLQIKNAGLPAPEKEYFFAPPRKWRFDFAYPEQLVAIEVEGISYQGGRHQRYKGFMEDCEKYERALELGWQVYRIPGPWIAKKSRTIWRPRTMDVLRTLLERGNANL